MKRKFYDCDKEQLNIDLYRKASLGIPFSNEELENIDIDSPAVTELPENIDTDNLKIFNRTLLSLVCTEGNCENLKKLLIHGSNPNQETSNKRQPIITAALAGHIDIIKILISHGANINYKMRGVCTPLLIAVSKNNFELVDEMIGKMKADPNLSDDKGITPMFIAASKGFNEIINILLKYGIDINCRMKGGCTPLLVAVSKNNFELVDEMIGKMKADPNLSDDKGITPMFIAASKGFNEIINILLKYGIDINCRMKGGWTPLLLAISNNHSKLVDEMIGELGADPNLPNDNDNQTPMYIAASKGFNEIIKILLKYKVDLSISRSCGASPLMIASQSGYLETCRLLLLYGAKVNYKMENGETPLILAVAFNHSEIVEEMIEHYIADPNLPGSSGRTPMYMAASKDYYKIIKILIKYGADLNIPDLNGSTPLSVASKFGFLKSCRLLLNYGADINYKNQNGGTPLIAAIVNNHFELVDEMIREFSADPNYIHENGQTLIHMAAVKGFNKVIKILLKYGVDINCKTEDGRTPLLLAVDYNHFELVDEMIGKFKADPNLPSDDGVTPICHAATKGYSEIIKILLKYGVDINCRMIGGSTPLLLAVYNNHCDLVDEMIGKLEADPNLPNNDGSTPMFIAASEGFNEIIKILLKHGAHVNMTDEMVRDVPDGTSTPLMVACEFGHFETCRLLLLNGAYINASIDDGYEFNTPLSLAVNSDELNLVKLLVEFGVDTSTYEIEIDPTEGPSFVEEYLQSVANERHITNLASVMKSIVDGILPLDILQILLFCLSKEDIIELRRYVHSLYNDISSCFAICYEEHPEDSVLSNIGQGYDGPLKQLVIDYLEPSSDSKSLINKFKFILDYTFDQTVDIELEVIKDKIQKAYAKLFL